MTLSEQAPLQAKIDHNIREGSLLVPELDGTWKKVGVKNGRRVVRDFALKTPSGEDAQQAISITDPRFFAWRDERPTVESYQTAAARLLEARETIDYNETTIGTVVSAVEYDEEGRETKAYFEKGPIRKFPSIEIVNAATGEHVDRTIDVLRDIASGELPIRRDEGKRNSLWNDSEGAYIAFYFEPSALIQNAMRRVGITHPERTAIEFPSSYDDSVHYNSFRSERIDSQLGYATWEQKKSGEIEAKSLFGGSRVAEKFHSIDEQLLSLQDSLANQFSQAADGRDVTWARRTYMMHEMAEFDGEHQNLIRLLGKYGLKPAYSLMGYETGTVAPTVTAVDGTYKYVAYLAQDEDLHGAIYDAQHSFNKQLARR